MLNAQIYLYFDGQAEEAAEFYRQALDAEVSGLTRFRDGPEQLKEMYPVCDADKVTYLKVKIGEQTLLFCDGLCAGQPHFTGFSIALAVPDVAAAERLFALLGAGGKVKFALEQTYFSPAYGMLADRFGVEWIIQADQVESLEL